MDQDWCSENNRRWSQEMLGFDPSYFQNMEGGQKPSYLYIGCSDSRAPAASLQFVWGPIRRTL